MAEDDGGEVGRRHLVILHINISKVKGCTAVTCCLSVSRGSCMAFPSFPLGHSTAGSQYHDNALLLVRDDSFGASMSDDPMCRDVGEKKITKKQVSW